MSERQSRVSIISTALMISTAFLVQPTTAAPTEVSAHRVAIGDVLNITVYGDPGLTGLFPVSVEGTIGYPLLGNVDVLGQTPDEIGSRITLDLSSHVANRSVAVAIKEYAPIFIVGDVQKPGRYEYRPGMIVLELFTLGGGMREPLSRADSSEVQLISARQEYEDTSLQLLSHDVKRHRLEAELNDKEFQYEAASAKVTDDPAAIARIVEAETKLYRLRLSVQKDERTNLEVQRQNFLQEIDTLEKGNILRNQQFELLGMDVNASEELVTRGAASQSALRERKRELLAMNQQLLESTSFLARAQQNRNEVERRILELDNKRKSDAATELRELELDMVRLRTKLSFILQTMTEIGAATRRRSDIDAVVRTEFTVVRQTEGQYREVEVNEYTAIESGDIIRVSSAVPQQFRSASGSNNSGGGL